MKERLAKLVRNLRFKVWSSNDGLVIVGTHDLRYLTTGSAPLDLICSRNNWKSNGGGRSLSTSLAALFGVLGAEPGVCGRPSSGFELGSRFKGDRAGPRDCDLLCVVLPCSCAVDPKVATVGLKRTEAWSIERGRDVRAGDFGIKLRAIAASPEREGVVDRDIDCARSWAIDGVKVGSGRGLSVIVCVGGIGTGSGTGMGAGGGKGAGLSWVGGSD